MNPEVTNALTGEARAEYLALGRMIESEGFQVFFMRRLREELDSARQRKEHATTWEANRVAHGEVSVYTALVGLEESIESEYASIAFQESAGRDE